MGAAKKQKEVQGHTPGPWDVQPPFSGTPSRWLVTSASGVVCDVGLNCGPQPANAKLIAAAPELLEALEELVGWLAESKLELAGHIGLDDARAAIAKARGR